MKKTGIISLTLFTVIYLTGFNKAFEESDYRKTKELADKISFLKEKVIDVVTLIKKAKEKIEDSENKGVDAGEAKEFLELACKRSI